MAAIVDIALVIDNTGSMGDDIEAVKENAKTIIEGAYGDDPEDPNDVRLSVVTYNDPDSEVVLPFTKDLDDMLNAIDSLTASGGGDFPEMVYTGLKNALDGSAGEWREEADVRKLILFGDAPAKDEDALRDEVLDLAADHGVALDEDPDIAIPVAICPIVIGGDEATTEDFTDIAESTGGEVFAAEDAEELVDVLTDVVETETEVPESDPVEEDDDDDDDDDDGALEGLEIAMILGVLGLLAFFLI